MPIRFVLTAAVLALATTTAAQRPQFSDAVRGFITTDADVIALTNVRVIVGDPSTAIGDVRRVETVFKAGIGYDRAKLVESVSGRVGLW